MIWCRNDKLKLMLGQTLLYAEVDLDNLLNDE